MKFCYKCGEQLNDEVVFCPKCGVKVDNAYISNLNEEAVNTISGNEYNIQKKSGTLPRKSMKIWAVICFVFAGIYILMGSVVLQAMLSAAVLFLVLGIMFVVLSKSPKENPYILGKSSGITKKKFVWGSIIIGYILCAIIMVSSSIGTTPTENVDNPIQNGQITTENISKEKVTYDITQFANITGEQLIELLGKPDNISNGKCTGSFEIPCTNYDYNNLEDYGEVSFVLVKNKVVRLTSYKDYKYSNLKNILSDFNIQKSENCTTVVNNDTALRYRCPNDNIDDFWITSIDEKNKSFGFLQITYDMEYYEEWYLPMSISDKSNYQYWTQETVKKLLKSPKSADFPSIDKWNIVKNKYYIGVQSYVDAQNSFGADIRNDFTFIYDTNNKVVYAIFDGEVILNEGYVKTEELVKKLIQ